MLTRHAHIACPVVLAYPRGRMLQPDFKPLTGLYTVQLGYKLISWIYIKPVQSTQSQKSWSISQAA